MFRILSLSIMACIVFAIFGCSLRRLPEEEYAKRAIDAYRQGNYTDAWANYRSLLSYYPESPKAPEYKRQMAEVLVNLADKTPENFSNAYIDELQRLGAATDTILSWFTYQRVLKISDETERTNELRKISFETYLFAAQYAVNRMRYDDAVAIYEKAYDFHSDNTKAYMPLFMAAFMSMEYLKDKERAAAHLRRFIEKFPNNDLTDDAEFLLKNIDKPLDEVTFLSAESKEQDAKTKSITPAKQKTAKTKTQK